MILGVAEKLQALTTLVATDSLEENRLVSRIVHGTAQRSVLVALASEQYRVITADRASFATMAVRASGTAAAPYFNALVHSEETALQHLFRFAAALELTIDDLTTYQPLPGCQAYPSYQARLALQGELTAVALAHAVTFPVWSSYCAAIGTALRAHYGFDDRGCGFFDFFAAPTADIGKLTHEALADDQGDTGVMLVAAEYTRLLHSYELMFWHTLADHYLC